MVLRKMEGTVRQQPFASETTVVLSAGELQASAHMADADWSTLPVLSAEAGWEGLRRDQP